MLKLFAENTMNVTLEYVNSRQTAALFSRNMQYFCA